MLGNEESAAASKINTVNLIPRTFVEHDYCKNKRVSCIKFHPQKPYHVAMSMTENLTFDERAEIGGEVSVSPGHGVVEKLINHVECRVYLLRF